MPLIGKMSEKIGGDFLPRVTHQSQYLWNADYISFTGTSIIIL